MNKTIRWITLAMVCAAVAACGGGGGSDTGGPVASADAPVVAMTAPPATKQLGIDYEASGFTLRWDAVAGADAYQVLKDPDGPAGPLPPYLQQTVAGTSLRVPVALDERLAATPTYRVSACRGARCEIISLPTAPDLNATIGILLRRRPHANDATGASLALSGDGLTLVAGAPLDGEGVRPGIESNVDADEAGPPSAGWGAVLVFTRADRRSPWQHQAVLRPSNAGPNLQFGRELAISTDGNTVAVGSPYDGSGSSGVVHDAPADAPSVPFSGAAFVFVRQNAQWAQQAYIKAAAPVHRQAFGSSVALSGDGNLLAVGVPSDKRKADDAGAAHLFTRSGARWEADQILTASNPDPWDYFGSKLALSADGRTLAVASLWEAGSGRAPVPGAPTGADTDNRGFGTGAVYVFTRDASGPWAQQAYIKGSRSLHGSEFGASISLSDDGGTLAVGAPLDDRPSADEAPVDYDLDFGAVYVFVRQAGVWSEQAFLRASHPMAGSRFGAVVALSATGDMLAVGAQGEPSAGTGNNGNQTNAPPRDVGAVYVLRRVAGVWAASAYLKAPDAASGAFFGASAGLSSDGAVLAIGAPGRKNNGAGSPHAGVGSSGAIYMY